MTRRAIGAIGVTVAFTAAASGMVVARSAGVGPPTEPTAFARARSNAAHTAMSGRAVSSHEDAEGLKLIPAAADESVQRGRGCPKGVPLRSYRVVAIAVDITVNRFGDHDPNGRMYVLDDDLVRVRDEERRNAAARAAGAAGDPAVSTGLSGGDAIQPLVLRVRAGECLHVDLRNDLSGAEAVSFHLHASSLRMASDGGAATIANPRTTVAPKASAAYEWMVPIDEPEGTHAFHSHPAAGSGAGSPTTNERTQTDHGLFGSVIVESAAATWLDPSTGEPLRTGWAAIIRDDTTGKSFRESVLAYHEVGDETYQLLNREGEFVPQVDALTSAYRPAARAINYRSEPFGHRLQLGLQHTQRIDESLEYSSYAYGDPPTPIMRAYLGDPVKQRLYHASGEVFHVHHVHGGAIRWRRQPNTESTAFDVGLTKNPPLTPTVSERTDSQSLGPSESFDVADECGAGGCQQSVGDYLYHCHVAQHYFAGMWGLWRVYNTLQDGVASTDSLPPLAELPDRAAEVAAAVTSDRLQIEDREATIERTLPPSGVRKGYDASVWDWTREGGRVVGEPEATTAWENYRSPTPGVRAPVLFEPRSGKLAYPFLRPHLAQRPPFPPDHNPSPYLDPVHETTEVPPIGGNGPASLCPSGTRRKQFDVNAISTPIALNQRANIVDPNGLLFVLREERDRVLSPAGVAQRTPLAIRANAGEDCVDILLRNEIPDNPNLPFSKVSLHVHFVQFDVQGGDGVDAGFNYEQSIRPFRAEGESIVSLSPGGERLTVSSSARFSVGATIGIGLDQAKTFEVRRITAIEGATLVLDRALASPHASGEIVSTEFARQRWYPDAQFGTAYFHDHINGLFTWSHGLFGALIAEPPGSTYHDPITGAPLASGPIADIHTRSRISADVTGSFREMAAFLQDDIDLTHIARSSGSAIGLRANPLAERDVERDPSQVFSSADHGDPETALLQAYLDDPVVIRGLVGSSNDLHTLHVDGHWFRGEPWNARSPPISTVQIGISERYDLVIPAAGGPQHRPGDYLYFDGRALKLSEGSWGLVRVLDRSAAASARPIRPLPGRDASASPASICPAGAPVRSFDVAAIEESLPMLTASTPPETGKRFVLAGSASATKPEPLVLHAAVGDCIKVTLTNRTKAGPVSWHADLLAIDPHESAGVAAGNEPDQSVAPGAARTYTLYASPEVGPTVSMVRDFGDVTRNVRLGLYAAIVVGPPGTTWTGSGAQVVGQVRGEPAWRDVTLFMQDEDEAIGTHRMPYTTKVRGVVGLNYGRTTETTPLITARAGDPLHVHVLLPWSEQAQVFTIDGHQWSVDAGTKGSNIVSSQALGGAQTMTAVVHGGAGGVDALAGDYELGDHRQPFREAGLFTTLRVVPHCGSAAETVPALPGRSGCGNNARRWQWIGFIALAAGLAFWSARPMVRRRMRNTRSVG